MDAERSFGVFVARYAARGSPLRYAAAGLLNSAAGYVVMVALGAASVGPYAANAAGFAAGFVVSLVLARGWTFAPAERPGAPARYAVAFAACYVLNLSCVGVGLSLGLPSQLAQAGGVAGYASTFYLACRWWVFGGAGVVRDDLTGARAALSRIRRSA